MGIALSVVVPAYNEEERIGSTLERMSEYLRENIPAYEIIVVDDGSADGTAEVVEGIGSKHGNIRLIRYPRNAGKGFAVRKGVLSSTGDLLLMSDADLSTPIEELERLLPFVREGFDVVIGSRGLPESDIVMRQPWYRERMGKTFNSLVHMLAVGGIHDTQCGFKLFRGDTAKTLFRKGLIDGFAFDVEILILAKKAGYRIKEVPIRWCNSPNSRVRLISDPAKMFMELLKIRVNLISGRYDLSSAALFSDTKQSD